MPDTAESNSSTSKIADDIPPTVPLDPLQERKLKKKMFGPNKLYHPFPTVWKFRIQEQPPSLSGLFVPYQAQQSGCECACCMFSV